MLHKWTNCYVIFISSLHPSCLYSDTWYFDKAIMIFKYEEKNKANFHVFFVPIKFGRYSSLILVRSILSLRRQFQNELLPNRETLRVQRVKLIVLLFPPCYLYIYIATLLLQSLMMCSKSCPPAVKLKLNTYTQLIIILTLNWL